MTPDEEDAWFETFLAMEMPGKKRNEVQKHDELFVRGSLITELILVNSGKFRVNATGQDGLIAVHRFAGPHDWLNLPALNGQSIHLHSAIATEHSEVTVFALSKFEQMRQDYLPLNGLLVRVMADYIVRQANAIDDSFFHSSDWRLTDRLLELFPANEAVTTLEIDMSLNKMAELIRCSHMTADRFVKASEKAGRITRLGGAGSRRLILHRGPMREFLLSESRDPDVQEDRTAPPLSVRRKLAK